MRAVNLLPRDARSRSGISGANAALVAAAGAAVLVVVVVGAGYATAHSHAAAEQKKLDAARAQLSTVVGGGHASTPPAKTTPILPVPAVTQELQPRLDALGLALSNRVAWDQVLREFSLVVPADVAVQGLSLAPTDGAGFLLTGLASSQDSVARLLSRLSLIPDLGDVSLVSASADPTTGQVSFTVTASVKTPAPEAVPSA
ncbi:MAG TPA: PilN domain-containing protein [Gaiellaceae bacterium]|nr:PilN domain-containing protein [Gaiellaceae bacterium]